MAQETKILEKFHLYEVVTVAALFFTGFGFLMSEMHRIEAKIDQQSSRSDRLYEMFIDLLKDKK